MLKMRSEEIDDCDDRLCVLDLLLSSIASLLPEVPSYRPYSSDRSIPTVWSNMFQYFRVDK
jgi:hypothetical protein